MIRYCVVIGMIICAVLAESFITLSASTQRLTLQQPNKSVCLKIANATSGKSIEIYHQQAFITNTTSSPHYFPLPESEEYEEDDELEFSKASLSRDNLSYVTLIRKWFEGFVISEQPLVAGSTPISSTPTPLHILLGVFRI